MKSHGLDFANPADFRHFCAFAVVEDPEEIQDLRLVILGKKEILQQDIIDIAFALRIITGDKCYTHQHIEKLLQKIASENNRRRPQEIECIPVLQDSP
jgi:hypothetical protein